MNPELVTCLSFRSWLPESDPSTTAAIGSPGLRPAKRRCADPDVVTLAPSLEHTFVRHCGVSADDLDPVGTLTNWKRTRERRAFAESEREAAESLALLQAGRARTRRASIEDAYQATIAEAIEHADPVARRDALMQIPERIARMRPEAGEEDIHRTAYLCVADFTRLLPNDDHAEAVLQSLVRGLPIGRELRALAALKRIAAKRLAKAPAALARVHTAIERRSDDFLLATE